MKSKNIRQQLINCLQLALQAIEQPELRRVAVKRGSELLLLVTGQAHIQMNPALYQVLSEYGIAEPTLSELALTTTQAQAAAWISYARQQKLGQGFVVMQLRAGTSPPAAPAQKTWFTPEEADTLFVR